MEVLECIKARRSIRKYLDKPIPWDLVAHIIDAGRRAPSSGNLQNWKFILALDADKRKAIAEASLKQYWMEQAPLHIIIVAEPEKVKRYYGERGERLYSVQNCSIVATQMMLEATNLGLGSCWVGAFDEDMVKRALGMPKEARPQIILTIGYAGEVPPESPRFPLEPITYFNKWRGRIRDVPSYFYYFTPKIQRGIKSTGAVAEKVGKSVMQKATDVAKSIRKKLEDKRKAQEARLREK